MLSSNPVECNASSSNRNATLHPAMSPKFQTNAMRLTTLLLGDTDSPSSPSGRLGVLSTDTETPVVAETAVSTDLLQALEILAELGVDTVGENLAVLAVHDIALSVEEPRWDFVLSWVLDDSDDSLELFRGEFSGTLVEINIGLLANQVGVTTSDTLYFGQGVHNLLLTLNIGVEKSQDELEVRLLTRHERHDGRL